METLPTGRGLVGVLRSHTAYDHYFNFLKSYDHYFLGIHTDPYGGL